MCGLAPPESYVLRRVCLEERGAKRLKEGAPHSDSCAAVSETVGMGEAVSVLQLSKVLAELMMLAAALMPLSLS